MTMRSANALGNHLFTVNPVVFFSFEAFAKVRFLSLPATIKPNHTSKNGSRMRGRKFNNENSIISSQKRIHLGMECPPSVIATRARKAKKTPTMTPKNTAE